LALTNGGKPLNQKKQTKSLSKESWLDPKLYCLVIKKGKAKKIMDDKLGQINEKYI
jgi:hypothetical protein